MFGIFVCLCVLEMWVCIWYVDMFLVVKSWLFIVVGVLLCV